MKVDVAKPADVPVILPMMEDFNRLEAIEWSRDSGEPALRRIVEGTSLGLVGLIRDDGESACGYFILTWGYDLEWNGRDAFMTELYVVPSERGRGVGGRALACVEQLAREHGAHAIHLLVRHENDVARRLYARAGFLEPGRAFLTKRL